MARKEPTINAKVRALWEQGYTKIQIYEKLVRDPKITTVAKSSLVIIINRRFNG